MVLPSEPVATTSDLFENMAELENDLWQFAVSFYSHREVSSACLVLQERLGVDVNVLLFVIFAHISRGFTLDMEQLARVDELVRAWRTEVVQVLRQIRKRLKPGPLCSTSPGREEFRNRIKQDELKAEQIELAILAGWLERQPHRSTEHLVDAQGIPQAVADYFARSIEIRHAPD